MDTRLVEAIRQQFEGKTTEELTRIYQAHNENEWSSEAFEAMRLILVGRRHGVPPTTDMQARVEATSTTWIERHFLKQTLTVAFVLLAAGLFAAYEPHMQRSQAQSYVMEQTGVKALYRVVLPLAAMVLPGLAAVVALAVPLLSLSAAFDTQGEDRAALHHARQVGWLLNSVAVGIVTAGIAYYLFAYRLGSW